MMRKILRPTPENISEIAQLHHHVLPRTTNSRLGVWFLKKLYNAILENNAAGNIYVAKEENRIIGFISFGYNYTTTKKTLEKSLSRKDIVHILLLLLKQPMLVKKLVKERLFSHFLNTQNQPLPIILTLGVAENQQGRGVAQELMNMAIDDIEKKGYKKIFLDTEKKNIRAQKFYEKYGFQKYGEKYGNVLFMYQKHVQ